MKSVAKKSVIVNASAKKAAVKKAVAKVAAKKHQGLLTGLREQKLAPVVAGVMKPKVKGVRKREFLPYKNGSAIQAIFNKLASGKPVEQKTLFAVPKKEYAKAALNRLARHGIVCGKWAVKLNGSKVQLLKKKGFAIPAAKAS